MTDTWDGRPQNPEEDGLHYITDGVALWLAGPQKWALLNRGRRERPEWLAAQPWAEYRGPCPTSAELETHVAAAREEGRIAGFEEAMDDLRDAPPLGVNRHGVMYLSPPEVEARVAAARREGIEAALAAVNAEPEPEGDMPAKLANTDKRILVIATVRATKRGIDGRIRALLEDKR